MDPIQRPPTAPPALFWRPPGPIPAGTPIVVAPTEIVVVVFGGAILGIITPGNYPLHPQALPLLGPSLDAGSNVRADLWFVFTSDFRGCKFGGPLGRHIDPSLGLEATPLTTGEYSIKVVDPPSFVRAHMSMTDGPAVLNAVSMTLLGKMKDLVSRLVAEKHSMLQMANVQWLLERLGPMLGDLNSVGLSVQVQTLSVSFSDEDRKALVAANAEKAKGMRARKIAEIQAATPAPAAAPGAPPFVAPVPGGALPPPARKRSSGLIVGGLVAVLVLGSIVAVVMHHSHAPPGAEPQHHGKH
jgi:membrane protease subunit (stomatin/prohibitin family)